VRRNQLWIVIAALIMLNCITIAYFLSNSNGSNANEDVVAKVGKNEILRQEWLNELETRYGKDVLKDMIDQQVVEEMATKYKIKVSEEDVDREYSILKTTYGSQGENKLTSEKRWKEHIRNSLLQEEILTRDVVITDEELKSYYKENKKQYNVPTAYHISHIVVKTESEAKKVINELSQGSSFSTLAMERSIEEFTANEGGDIGYIIDGEERFPPEYIQMAEVLKKGEYSEPIKVDGGYAVIKLEERLEGKNYSFEEVKHQVRREIALEQMKTSTSIDAFWDEAKVEWFYGKEKAN
jgi:foldase protein PrsA